MNAMTTKAKAINQKSADILKISREIRLERGLLASPASLCETVARAEVEYDAGRRPQPAHEYSYLCDCPSCKAIFKSQ